MTEVTVTSTSTPVPSPCPPPRKKARVEDTDLFQPVGSLTCTIDNFCAFTKRPAGLTGMRHCDSTVSVRGLTFGLAIYPFRGVYKDQKREGMCMGVNVKCENASGCNVNGDGSWSCLAAMAFRFKRLLKERADVVDLFTHRFFSSSSGKDKSSLEWYGNRPLSFTYLLDPKNGFYNEKDDTLKMIVEIAVDMPVGIVELSRTDAIQVNEQTVFVNKNQLAMFSPYFHSLFYNAQFDEGKNGGYKLEIEAPATVEHFKRMLDTMSPMNKPLDDECIEGVLHLANRFLVAHVEGKCLDFLTERSKKPALFKYRVADKYGYTALKNHVLLNLKITDFKGELFRANMAEFNQLGPDAAEAFMARYDALYPPKPTASTPSQ